VTGEGLVTQVKAQLALAMAKAGESGSEGGANYYLMSAKQLLDEASQIIMHNIEGGSAEELGMTLGHFALVITDLDANIANVQAAADLIRRYEERL